MKRISLSALFVVLTVCLGPGCDDGDVFREDVVQVIGVVTDSVSGVAIDSAIIALDDTSSISTYTDSAGFYEHIQGGSTARVYALKSGYHTQSKLATGRVGGDTLDFRLVPQ